MAKTGKLGRSVALVGAGMSKFGAFKEKSSRDLYVEAFQEMKASVDKGLDPNDIQAIYVGCFAGELFESQGHIAPIVTEWVGLVPRPATRVEDACASGGVALRQGILAIASGLYDIVLVSGVEKMNNLPTDRVTDALAAPILDHRHAADLAVGQQPPGADRLAGVIEGDRMDALGVQVVQFDPGGHVLLADENAEADRSRDRLRLLPAHDLDLDHNAKV